MGPDDVITDGRNRTSKIVTADIATTNGVIHIIDKVLLPADKNIVQTAAALPDFPILVEAVQAAGLADTLSGPGPFTVFAPTNEAFAALLSALGVTKDELLANMPLLPDLLQRASRGDAAAVKECVSRFGPLVWGLARRMSPTRADAEDAVQDVYLDLWAHGDRFDPARASPELFVAVIARRRLIDRRWRDFRRLVQRWSTGARSGAAAE
jgi:hypothetical protein